MATQIISQETLKKGVDKVGINGVILCRGYNIQLTKNGKEYVQGTLESGISIPFKAWSSSAAFSTLKNEDHTNIPIYITGSFDNYGGSLSIILDTVQAVSDFTLDQFLPVKYNADAYYEGLVKLFNSKVSDKCQQIAKEALFNNEELVEKFKLEFSASSHHDNCKSGLLAHTYKVLSSLNFLLSSYPQLLVVEEGQDAQDFVDLLYLGALLHDIGKVDEMNLGVYQPLSCVTHRYLGIEYVQNLKDIIISQYSEKWYYHLISIFLQHHGEFDDNCRTLASRIIHEADMFDSQMTLLCQLLEAPQQSSAGKKVRFDNANLLLY